MAGTTDGPTDVLQSTSDYTLFLSKHPEEEVHELCAGIERVVQAGGEFRFEPIDERDFIMEIERRGDELIVTVDATERPFSKAIGWPEGLAVSASALTRFSEGLRLEYAEICAAESPKKARER